MQFLNGFVFLATDDKKSTTVSDLCCKKICSLFYKHDFVQKFSQNDRKWHILQNIILHIGSGSEKEIHWLDIDLINSVIVYEPSQELSEAL